MGIDLEKLAAQRASRQQSVRGSAHVHTQYRRMHVLVRAKANVQWRQTWPLVGCQGGIALLARFELSSHRT